MGFLLNSYELAGIMARTFGRGSGVFVPQLALLI